MNFFEAVKETGFAKHGRYSIYRLGENAIEFWSVNGWAPTQESLGFFFRDLFKPCEDPAPKPPREWWIDDDHVYVWTKEEMIKHGYPFDRFIHVREVQE